MSSHPKRKRKRENVQEEKESPIKIPKEGPERMFQIEAEVDTLLDRARKLCEENAKDRKRAAETSAEALNMLDRLDEIRAELRKIKTERDAGLRKALNSLADFISSPLNE
jgi:hypothetical protein